MKNRTNEERIVAFRSDVRKKSRTISTSRLFFLTSDRNGSKIRVNTAMEVTRREKRREMDPFNAFHICPLAVLLGLRLRNSER